MSRGYHGWHVTWFPWLFHVVIISFVWLWRHHVCQDSIIYAHNLYIDLLWYKILYILNSNKINLNQWFVFWLGQGYHVTMVITWPLLCKIDSLNAYGIGWSARWVYLSSSVWIQPQDTKTNTICIVYVSRDYHGLCVTWLPWLMCQVDTIITCSWSRGHMVTIVNVTWLPWLACHVVTMVVSRGYHGCVTWLSWFGCDLIMYVKIQ